MGEKENVSLVEATYFQATRKYELYLLCISGVAVVLVSSITKLSGKVYCFLLLEIVRGESTINY